MKWNSTLLQMLCMLYAVLLCFSHTTIRSHTSTASNNSSAWHPIYNLNNQKTSLVYHLDSGTVYTQDMQLLYTHVHFMYNELPTQGTILGFIKKAQKNNPQRCYVYIEPNKIKKRP